MGSGKECLGVCPHLVGRCHPLPVFGVLDEHACLENNLESVGDDLEWGVRILACIRIFNGILDFFKYPFDGLIHIIGCFEAGVVLNELSRSDVGIRRVQMREHLAGGYVGIAHVAGLDSAEEDVADSTYEELFECLVGVVVFLE